MSTWRAQQAKGDRGKKELKNQILELGINCESQINSLVQRDQVLIDKKKSIDRGRAIQESPE